MRAGPLSDRRVIDALNRDFVCVYTANEDYYGPKARLPIEERNELMRIRLAASAKHLSVGTVHAFVLTPDGEPYDSLHVKDAAQTARTLAMLDKAVAHFKPTPGPPVVSPQAQSVPPDAPADALVLHLVSRKNGRGSWGDIPAENWIVLTRDDWSRLLPANDVKPGQTWELDPEVTAKVLTYFYPQTENNDAAIGRIEKQTLTAKALTVDDSRVTARVDGFVKMHHAFYPGPKDVQPLTANVVGALTFARAGPPSLELVTTEAVYGQQWFNVAVDTLQK